MRYINPDQNPAIIHTATIIKTSGGPCACAPGLGWRGEEMCIIHTRYLHSIHIIVHYNIVCIRSLAPSEMLSGMAGPALVIRRQDLNLPPLLFDHYYSI